MVRVGILGSVGSGKSYVDLERIREELEESRKVFKLNNIPTIDVTRKSVEETAASIIKIHEIKNS